LSLLSVQQAPAILGVSRTTVKRIIESGELRAVPIAKGARKTTYRIRAEVLERWVTVKERELARELAQNRAPGRAIKTPYANGSDTPTVPPQESEVL
jgi:excisionase family DNA binding protein